MNTRLRDLINSSYETLGFLLVPIIYDSFIQMIITSYSSNIFSEDGSYNNLYE